MSGTSSLPWDHGRPSDPEVASKSPPYMDKVVLQVIDAHYDGAMPQVRKMFLSDDNIAEGLDSLPPHAHGTARIWNITIHSDFVITGLRHTRGPETTRPARDSLMDYLQKTYMQPFDERRIFRWLNDPLLVNDIGSISSQWSQSLGGGSTKFYRLVNRTSLQQNPLDFDLHPRDSYFTCVQDANDRLIVIIVNDVWSEQTYLLGESSHAGIEFHNPRSISAMLAGTGWTALSDGTRDTFAKHLILDFFLASVYLQRVDYYERLIYPDLPEKEALRFSLTKNPHLQVPLGLFEPRLSAKSAEAFQEIVDAEGILRSVNNLVDSIEFVLAALAPNDHDDRDTTAAAAERLSGDGRRRRRRREYERRRHELQGLCAERRNNAQRALEALNRQLDYLSKKHAIREANAIRILTILASLYLPLSLSAGLLGMQTPFKQVAHTQTAQQQSLVGTNLLFDFFGVFLWLATSTILIFHTIRLSLWLQSNGLGKLSKIFRGPFSIFTYGKHWRFGGRGGKTFGFFRGATTWWVGVGFCVTLLVIFFVGMLRNAQNAWDTAKWMFTTYLVGSGMLFGLCVAIYFCLSRGRIKS